MPHSQYTSHLHLRTYTPEVHSHSHDHSQWVLPITGSLELSVDSLAGIADPDRAIYIPPGAKHGYASMSQNRFLVLDMSMPNPGLAIAQSPHFFSLSAALKQFIQFAALYLADESVDSTAYHSVKEFLTTILMQQFLSKMDSKVLFIKNWIDKNFARPIDLSGLSAMCHLSSSQLQRRFSAQMGVGLAQYWRLVRLQQADNLLLNPMLNVTQIAYRVGFDNLASFIRSFHKQYGVSPSLRRKTRLLANQLRESAK
jgi:AraC-like DNA-binding protein